MTKTFGAELETQQEESMLSQLPQASAKTDRHLDLSPGRTACGRDFDDEFDPDEDPDWDEAEPDPDEFDDWDDLDLDSDDEEEDQDDEFADDEPWDDEFDPQSD
jgi:hypothetical protein